MLVILIHENRFGATHSPLSGLLRILCDVRGVQNFCTTAPHHVVGILLSWAFCK